MRPAPRRYGMLAAIALLVLSAAACQTRPDQSDDDGTRISTAAGDILAATQDAATSSVVSAGPTVSLGPPAAPPNGQEALDIASLGFDLGAADAPVRIVEFSDYGCGFCRKFHLETWPTLKKDYVDTGKVFWKTIPFVIGSWANSVDASMGGECAVEQGKAERMTALLFERQSDWKSVADPAPPIAAIAEAAGLDMTSFQTCIDESRYLWRVQAHTELARQVGVRGTPTFVVIGYAPVQGALPLELFKQVIDTVLAKVEAEGR
ncbi:MAG: hypothetical protein BMS9Abin29_0001 [Gemmatimonadota bacterium]|nr:MAG: hypothetical protein BMS9Abin29_0001 [Gemmatimonadota bacterium]